MKRIIHNPERLSSLLIEATIHMVSLLGTRPVLRQLGQLLRLLFMRCHWV
jgi:hypothetical protein